MLRIRRWLGACALLLVLASRAGPAAAHDPGLSSVLIRVKSQAIEAVVRVNEADFREALEPTALQLRVQGRELVPEDVRAFSPASGERGVLLRYATPRPRDLTVTSNLLAALPPGHKQYARVEGSGGELLANKVLTRRHPSLQVTLATQSAGDRFRAAGGFVELGIGHILRGYDHLLFLLTLLVGCSGWRPIVRIITAFTVAHSFTLAGATLGWIALSPAVVEPAIAVSIVYVAILNLVGRGRAQERLAVTFGFGLIHGLGFAGALADLGAQGDVAIPLLAFNAGVEAGQLVIAAGALPILLALRRHPPLHRAVIPACSSLAATLGCLWLIERTLLA